MGNDVNVYEVFGLEAPAEDPAPAGENGQEVAEPANGGENEQAAAAPATEEDGSKPAEEPDVQPDKQPQTKEQRAENARKRRQQEVDDAVNAALQKERDAQNERWNNFFSRAGMKNNYTGKPITSLEDFEAWEQANKAAAVQKDLKAGKLTPEALSQLIENSPTMQKARELTEQAEQAAQETRNARYAQQVEQEMAEIRKLDPTVQGLTDIIQSPAGQKFAELVQQHGLSYLDAFKLANMDRLTTQARNVAAAGAQMRTSSKDHLQRTDMRGQGAVEVPEDVMACYRIMNPNKSDEEIRRDYQRRTPRT